jgi:hypothetical protein
VLEPGAHVTTLSKMRLPRGTVRLGVVLTYDAGVYVAERLLQVRTAAATGPAAYLALGAVAADAPKVGYGCMYARLMGGRRRIIKVDEEFLRGVRLLTAIDADDGGIHCLY